MSEAWSTDEDLKAARERFEARTPGYVAPVAYSVARKDPAGLTFGHVNRPGGKHRLPVAALAAYCGYTATTAVEELAGDRLAEVVEALAPAEAATHVPHPNLWSWRKLLADAGPDSTYLAFFLVNPDDPAVSDEEGEFRLVLGRLGPS